MLEKQKILEQFSFGNKYKPIRLKRELSKIVWENAGIVRIENGLKSALKALNEIKEKTKFIHISFEHRYNHHFLEAMELQFMLLTAQSVVLSALQRTESRGSHYRSDYPIKDINWQKKNVLVKYSQEKLLVEG
jgi:succinate dehydrogenase / fumarate reductase, flavoprotein subunit